MGRFNVLNPEFNFLMMVQSLRHYYFCKVLLIIFSSLLLLSDVKMQRLIQRHFTFRPTNCLFR